MNDDRPRYQEPPPKEPCGCCHGREFWALPTLEHWVCVVCHPPRRDDVVPFILEASRA